MGTGPPASIGSAIKAENEYGKLQVPVSNRANRPYESQLSTCSPAVTRTNLWVGARIRTRLAGLRGRHPEPLDERAILFVNASGRS